MMISVPELKLKAISGSVDTGSVSMSKPPLTIEGYADAEIGSHVGVLGPHCHAMVTYRPDCC